MSKERRPAEPPRLFGPGPNPLAHAPGAENARAAARRLWGYLRLYRGQLWLVIALVVLTSLLGAISPYLMKTAIDGCIVPRRLTALAEVVALLALVNVLSTAGMWYQSVVMIRVSQQAVRDLRADLFAALQRLALRWFDEHPHGDTMSRLTNDVDSVNAVLSQAVTQLIGSVLGLAASFTAMLLLNVRLTLAALAVVPPVVLLTRSLGLATRRTFRARQAALGALNGSIEETLTGQKVVKAYRREPTVLAQFDEANETWRGAALSAAKIGGLMGPCMNFTRNVSFAVLVGYGCLQVLHGRATVGTVFAFLEYSGQFMRPLLQVAGLYGMVQGALAGAERVFATMDEPPELPDEPDAVALETVRGEVAFEGVTFGYDAAAPVLHDVSFTARAGQTVALVGPTGAGKTTLINLLARFYDVQGGRIVLDGHDLRQLRREDLRRALGIVPQDTFLFADTVRENIRYGRLEATDAEVEQAARLANADGFIHHLPQGYATLLSEAGSSLSQGQRQLLAIARAILADPAVLVLDEATSSVDTATEAHIQEAMLRLLAGRTAFIIAHRLSTVRHADLILVIADGRLAESGTHEQLMESGGLYQQMRSSGVDPL